MAYRADIVDLILQAQDPIRRYLIERTRQVVAPKGLPDVISGCLLPDPVSQAALPILMTALRLIST